MEEQLRLVYERTVAKTLSEVRGGFFKRAMVVADEVRHIVAVKVEKDQEKSQDSGV